MPDLDIHLRSIARPWKRAFRSVSCDSDPDVVNAEIERALAKEIRAAGGVPELLGVITLLERHSLGELTLDTASDLLHDAVNGSTVVGAALLRASQRALSRPPGPLCHLHLTVQFLSEILSGRLLGHNVFLRAAKDCGRVSSFGEARDLRDSTLRAMAPKLQAIAEQLLTSPAAVLAVKPSRGRKDVVDLLNVHLDLGPAARA